MCGRIVFAEAPQYQVVVCVVLRVPDRYVLEQTTVFAQDAVSLGVHRPAAPVHGPCTAILQLRRVPWEEVAGHVLQYLLLQGCCNPLVPLPLLCCSMGGVEIAYHHQRGPPRPLGNDRNDALYGQGVVWGQVAPHNIPPPVQQAGMPITP